METYASFCSISVFVCATRTCSIPHVSTLCNRSVQSNLDYPDSLGPDEIVRIIENMNINEEQN